MKLLETALVTVGIALAVVELTRRLHGNPHFLQLEKNELLSVTRVLAVSLASLFVVYLVARLVLE